jgi:hypothetical protein
MYTIKTSAIYSFVYTLSKLCSWLKTNKLPMTQSVRALLTLCIRLVYGQILSSPSNEIYPSSSGNASDWYSEGVRFDYRWGRRLSWLRFLTVLMPRTLPSTIHYSLDHPIIRLYYEELGVVTVDGVLIGEWIYWPLVYTTWNYTLQITDTVYYSPH